MYFNRSRYENSSVFRKPQLLQGVYAMGFNRPSKIQENALPMMLAEPYVHIIPVPSIGRIWKIQCTITELHRGGWRWGESVALSRCFRGHTLWQQPWICPFPRAGTEHAAPRRSAGVNPIFLVGVGKNNKAAMAHSSRNPGGVGAAEMPWCLRGWFSSELKSLEC